MSERPPPAPPAPPPVTGWAPLAATCLGQGMVVLDATIVNVALPAMRRGLQIGPTELQWVINAYLLSLGGLILLGGRLGDQFGRKRVYLLGGAVFSAASLAGGLAPSGGVLLAARAVQGVGAALLAPGSLSLLATAYGEGRARTRALAVWSATSAGGGAVGILLGGVLTSLLGWRAVMFVNVPLGALVIVLGGTALRESAVRTARRLDVPGALAVTAALTTLVYGVVETTHHPWGSTRTLAVLGVAVALFALTALIEARSPNPLIPFAVLRRGTVATATALMLIHGATVTSALYFQSLYLQDVRRYSPLGAGLLMMPFSLLLIFTPVLASRVTTRHGPRAVAMGSLLVEFAGLVWLSRWTVHGSIVLDMIAPGIVFGVGGSVCFFAISVLMTSSIERERSGLGSGLFNTGRQVGGSIGLAALTVVAAARTRSLEAAHTATSAVATADGYGRAMLVTAVLVGLGFALIAVQRWPRMHAPIAGRGAAQPSEGSPR